MSNTTGTKTSRTVGVATETKPSTKTTELYVFIVVALGVLIASAVVDNNEDGSGFDANHAWLYVSILAVGYMISRGIAKSGSYDKARLNADDRS
jgi:fucose permease